MNNEYKVGYHWKSIGKDPGQQSLFGGIFNKTARTEPPIRPSGLCGGQKTERRVSRLLVQSTHLFARSASSLGRGQHGFWPKILLFLSFLLSFFLFLVL